ncbi:hypothetical protein [Sphingomonas sp. OTU376]|uniref:hypothetical protein n=1 Tax=Sphingomonas sp. OTU376 TaxID=3043863 RepID=UPI00313BE763
MAAAGRARDTAKQTELWIKASDAVKSAMPTHSTTPPHTDSQRAYARTAEILGEHDEIEAAE